MCGRQVVVHGHAGLLYFRLDLSPNKCATIILFSMSVCLSFFLGLLLGLPPGAQRAAVAAAVSSEFTLINVNNFTLRCSSYADKPGDKDISRARRAFVCVCACAPPPVPSVQWADPRR